MYEFFTKISWNQSLYWLTSVEDPAAQSYCSASSASSTARDPIFISIYIKILFFLSELLNRRSLALWFSFLPENLLSLIWSAFRSIFRLPNWIIKTFLDLLVGSTKSGSQIFQIFLEFCLLLSDQLPDLFDKVFWSFFFYFVIATVRDFCFQFFHSGNCSLKCIHLQLLESLLLVFLPIFLFWTLVASFLSN